MADTSLDFAIRHSHYAKRKPVWDFSSAHYEAGDGLVDGGFLKQFSLESSESFSNRAARSVGLYENLVSRAILIYISQMFRVEPDRSKLPAQLMDLVKDVDLFGTDASAFFWRVDEMAELHGISYVLVDSPRFRVEAPTTNAEVKARRLRPWFEMLDATQVVDWDIETRDQTRRGMLNYAVIRDEFERREGPGKRATPVIRYRTFTTSEWAVYEGDSDGGVALVSNGSNEIGEVPLIPCYARRVRPMQGATIIDDIARKANALWNRSSVRDENFYYQGFNQLVIKSEDKNLGQLKLGVDRAIKLGPTDDAYYLSPTSVAFEAYRDFAREMIDSSADMIFARTTRQLPTAQVQSAEKTDLDRYEFVALLKSKAQQYEDCETQCWRTMALFYGMAPATPAIESIVVIYNREFKVEDLVAEEWIKRVEARVVSRVEWRRALYPSESMEAAEQSIKKNAELEDSLSPLSQQNDQVSKSIEAALGMMREGNGNGAMMGGMAEGGMAAEGE